jgi:hypothetical protein
MVAFRHGVLRSAHLRTANLRRLPDDHRATHAEARALHQEIAPDTKTWSSRADFIDFVLENRGKELSNIRIISTPDDIGWEQLDARHPGRKTSEHFAEMIPYLGESERRQFPWCAMRSNEAKVGKPFSITIEYDNPLSLWKRRGRRTFDFNLASLKGTRGGLARRYDDHNIAQECAHQGAA